MANKAFFFRDINDIDQLEAETKKALISNDIHQGYISIATVVLSEEGFQEFTRSFMKTQNFLESYRAKLTMNVDLQYVCITVRSETCNKEVLVNTSGYSYARMVAIKKST